jgi:hypothetical protein
LFIVSKYYVFFLNSENRRNKWYAYTSGENNAFLTHNSINHYQYAFLKLALELFPVDP